MGNVNWDAAKFWLDIVQWLVLIAVVIASWVRTGSNQNRDVIEQLDERVDQLDRRVISTEERLNHAPTHEDITAVQTKIAGLGSKLDQVSNTVDRIAGYLMNKEK